MPLLRTTLLVQLLLHIDTSWPLSPVLYCSARTQHNNGTEQYSLLYIPSSPKLLLFLYSWANFFTLSLFQLFTPIPMSFAFIISSTEKSNPNSSRYYVRCLTHILGLFSSVNFLKIALASQLQFLSYGLQMPVLFLRLFPPLLMPLLHPAVQPLVYKLALPESASIPYSLLFATVSFSPCVHTIPAVALNTLGCSKLFQYVFPGTILSHDLDITEKVRFSIFSANLFFLLFLENAFCYLISVPKYLIVFPTPTSSSLIPL